MVKRAALAAGQEPFAIILGCSDSRVPAELVFDQGFGDLFVIRVAGNIVAPSQVGSVEFAASRFGTRLVVVLGHSGCGAIIATLEEITGHATSQSRNLRSIVDRVRPSVETLLSGRRDLDSDDVDSRGCQSQCARVGGSLDTWISAAGATQSQRWAEGDRRGVLAGDRGGDVLRCVER